MADPKEEQKRLINQLRGFDSDHYARSDKYARQIDALTKSAANEYAQLAGTLFQPDLSKPFAFDNYPQTKKKAQAVARNLARDIKHVVEQGTEEEWVAACGKNDAFLKSILKTSKLTPEEAKQYHARNMEALHSFQQRKVQGMGLSARVWKVTKQIQSTIELGIDVALGEGKSARELSKDVRECLQQPDKLFRRVRDKEGNLHLSKAASLYHPGRGVYRSSAQNAMRLARTEINMAYRQAEFLRWQQLDFVVGFRVCLSNNHTIKDSKGYLIPLEDICDELAGDYPKGFKFVGWHPNCRCYVVPILSDYDEYNKERAGRLKAIIQGTKYKAMPSRRTITAMPANFTAYIASIAERSKAWASQPFYIRDNFVGGVIAGGLNPGIATKLNGQTAGKVVANNSNPCTEFDGRIAAMKKWAYAFGLDVSRLDSLRMAGGRNALLAELDTLGDLAQQRQEAWLNAYTELYDLAEQAGTQHFTAIEKKYKTVAAKYFCSPTSYYADSTSALIQAKAQAQAELAAAKAAEAKADYSKLMPAELKEGGAYLGKTKYKFDKGFFDKLDHTPTLEIRHTNKGSYETNNGEKVVFDCDKRNKVSEWHKKSVVYHEFGHAIGDQRKLINSPELLALRAKIDKWLRERIETQTIEETYNWETSEFERTTKRQKVMRAKVLGSQLSRVYNAAYKMKPETFTKRGITRDDFIEQLTSVADTLKSLVKSVGWGHSNKYFSSSRLSQHEFLAHCFENRYVGNEVFKRMMPDVYKLMIDYINGLKF